MKASDAVFYYIGAIVVLVVLGFILSYPAMLLWNSCLVPAVPALQQVSWLQMWGISILFALILPRASSTVNKK
jgi:hypothetical protein